MTDDADDEKDYILLDDEAEPVVTGMGACFATDRVTVEGLPVRFMYRETPDNERDSGWRFCSGMDEDEEYMSNPDNIGIFDVNTIANLDRSIVLHLLAPAGSAFEKAPGDEKFTDISDEFTEDD